MTTGWAVHQSISGIRWCLRIHHQKFLRLSPVRYMNIVLTGCVTFRLSQYKVNSLLLCRLALLHISELTWNKSWHYTFRIQIHHVIPPSSGQFIPQTLSQRTTAGTSRTNNPFPYPNDLKVLHRKSWYTSSGLFSSNPERHKSFFLGRRHGWIILWWNMTNFRVTDRWTLRKSWNWYC